MEILSTAIKFVLTAMLALCAALVIVSVLLVLIVTTLAFTMLVGFLSIANGAGRAKRLPSSRNRPVKAERQARQQKLMKGRIRRQ